MPVVSRIVAVVLTLTGMALAAPAPAPAPTADELKQLYEGGKYDELLPKLTRVLALKGDAAKAYNRYELLMMKGEAQLHQKAYMPAADAFTAAAKETTEAKDADAARALAVLVKRSRAGAYQPKASAEKGKPAAAIPIIDADNRKRAFESLLADQLAQANAKVKSAESATALGPVLELAKLLGDTRAVELAATGDDVESKKLNEVVIKEATRLVSGSIHEAGVRVMDIRVEANRPLILTGDNRSDVVVRQGLNSNQTKQLQEILATCEKLTATFEELGKSLGDEKAFADVTADIAKVRDDADHTLNTDYAGRKSSGTKR